MKILVAPLNWGLGHASRCVPLVQRFLNEGHDVLLGGDGESLTLLRRHFPQLRYVYLAPLSLRYSAGNRQVWAILKAIPKLLIWSLKDHTLLKALLRDEHIDRIVSDNRFGLYHASVESVYITHQLHIFLPRGWRWAEPIAARLHARIYSRFTKVWVPDYEDPAQSLAGELSHPSSFRFVLSPKIEYIGPLSRFASSTSHYLSSGTYDIVVVLSGLEPHRTLLEQELIASFASSLSSGQKVLVIQGQLNRPNTRFKRGNITLVPHIADEELAKVLLGAKHIIARSGYSTIMDLHALGLLTADKVQINAKIELIPTPGQPEQEYLATYITEKIQKNA